MNATQYLLTIKSYIEKCYDLKKTIYELFGKYNTKDIDYSIVSGKKENNNEEDKALAEIMQNQLKDIGIELKIKPLDNAALYESTKNDQYQLTIQGQN